MAEAAGPWPLERGDVQPMLAALARGTDWRTALEALLLGLPLERAERLMQLSREGRGAFLPLLREPPDGNEAPRALLVGNALSGTLVALARAGYRVVALDPEPERLLLARARDRALAGGQTRFLRAEPRSALPFRDAVFDLVVAERGAGWNAAKSAELRRVTRGELLIACDNRLAYKRSSGVRADFRVPGPREWLGQALKPKRGERTLAAYRRDLGRSLWPAVEAFALYPHAEDFSHVVALDGPRPRLSIGPKERQNPLKVAADRLGLFPWLTPSFLLRASSGQPGPRRVETWLAAVAEAAGEPAGELEILVSTRGNTALLLTALSPEDWRDGDDLRGRFALHVPLSPQQEEQARRHIARLRELARRFPGLPVPKPLFEGTVGGQYLSAERRLPGFTAPQFSGDARVAARLYTGVDEQLAGLVVERCVLDEAEFEVLFAAKFERVARLAGRAETAARIRALLDELRPRLLGAEIPLVVQHADLRGKHIQVDRDGRVLGYLDWGSSESRDLPWFDLANLVLHDTKQEHNSSAGVAWQRLVAGDIGAHGARALASHAERLALPAEWTEALLLAHPVLVAAMAEKNWDYSRPRWLHRNFGL